MATLRQFAEEQGIPLSVVHQRKSRGWSLERALTESVSPRIGPGVKVSADLAPDVHEQLERLARLRRTRVAALVRAAVGSYLRTRVEEAAE